MTTVENARQIINQIELPTDLGKRVSAREVREYYDWTGDEALHVTLILSEDTQSQERNGRSLIDVKSAVHDALIKAGIDLYPYIHFAKQSELNEVESETQ